MTPPTWWLDVDGVVVADRLPAAHHDVDLDTYRQVDVTATDHKGQPKSYPLVFSTNVVTFINDVSRSGAARIVWLTTWEQEAATVLAPALGFDEFEVANRPDGVTVNEHPGYTLGWWKEVVVRRAYVEGVDQIVWTDDDLNKPIRARTKLLMEDQCLLVTPAPVPGLTNEHIGRIRSFLSR